MNLKADTCVCGSDQWHEIRAPYVYCLRCGSLRRIILESKWTIPIDRTNEMRDAVAREQRENRDRFPKSDPPPPPPSGLGSGEWPRSSGRPGGKPPSEGS